MSWQSEVVKFATGAIIDGIDEVQSARGPIPGNAGGAGYGNVILRTENVRVEGLGGSETLCELILTDAQLILDIYVDEGALRRRHRYDYLPLGEVMCEGDEPCVSAEKRFLLGWSLKVEFKYSTKLFSFTSDEEAQTRRWASAICKQVSRIREAALERRHGKQPQREQRTATSGGSRAGAERVAPTPPPQAQPQPRPQPRIVVAKCRACHAPLSGAQGTITTCAYCDTRQSIE